MRTRMLHAAQIMWPAFMMAGVLEMIVFAWVDPSHLQLGAWQPDTKTTYSLAFFAFWGLITLASLMSHWMMKSAEQPTEARRERRLARRHHVHRHA